MRVIPVFLALALGACASRPVLPPEYAQPDPAAPPRVDRVVAYVDGQPITWRQVAERAMEAGGRMLVDEYIRWKLKREAIRKLGIENSPEELRARAQATVDQVRKKQGDEKVKAQLAQLGETEASYIERSVANPLFAERLLAEKAYAYAMLTEPTIEADMIGFLDESDAGAFLARIQGGETFEKAEEASLASVTKGRVMQWPRRRLAHGFLPLTMESLEKKLFEMKEGDTTGLEHTLDNLFVIARVAGARPATAAPFVQLRERVMEDILRSPPSEEQLNLWMERLLKGSKILYEDRNTARDKVR